MNEVLPWEDAKSLQWDSNIPLKAFVFRMRCVTGSMNEGTMSHPATIPVSPTQPKLLDQVRAMIRTKHYSRRTEEAYSEGFGTVYMPDALSIKYPNANLYSCPQQRRPGNPFANLSPEIADRFAEIVASRYGNDFEAAIRGFVSLHGKK